MNKIANELIKIAEQLSALQQFSDILLQVEKTNGSYDIVCGERFYGQLYSDGLEYNDDTTISQITNKLKLTEQRLRRVIKGVANKYPQYMAGVTGCYMIQYNGAIYIVFKVQQVKEEVLEQVAEYLKSQMI